MAAMTRLETKRLILRQFREEDVEAYRRMVNDPDTMAAMGDTELISAERSWRMIATYLGHWTIRGYGPFAVEERASGELVGRVGPWSPGGWPGIELIWLIDQTRWGRGYAPEAASAARDFALAAIGEAELISLVEPTNTASRRVAEKLGARPVRQVEHDGLTFDVYRHAPRA
jgi:RimJ/RimL family protein N-acetyltransferase